MPTILRTAMNLRNFLRLAAIIGPLPNIIKDGDLVDAVPVMNDFNWIVNQVNANVPPLIPTITNPIIYVPQAAVGGSANAITLTPTPAIGAYAEGQSFRFRATTTNTSAVTIATSGLAVRAVQTPAGAALSGGEIQAGGEYDVVDTGSVYMLMGAQATALATWTPGIAFGGAAVGVTYTSQTGHYVKLNNLVFIWGSFTINNPGVSAGAATITGLPFNINGGITVKVPFVIHVGNAVGGSPGGNQAVGGGVIGTNTIALLNMVFNSTDIAWSNFQIGAGFFCFVAGVYPV
jgi:hypothetical protein